MSKPKRFPSWQPTVGERALVPGGPANAQYVDELSADDVAAIENGHRGYTPLQLQIIGEPDDPRHEAVIDTIDYQDNGYWLGNMVRARRPSDILRAARQYYTPGYKNIRLDVPT